MTDKSRDCMPFFDDPEGEKEFRRRISEAEFYQEAEESNRRERLEELRDRERWARFVEVCE